MKQGVWSSTKHRNLFRHKSGVYYARITVDGKRTWRSLKTKLASVAKPALDEMLEAERKKAQIVKETGFKGKMLIGDALEIRKNRIANDPSLKPATKHYWDQVHTALLKSWKGIEELDIANVTAARCEKWAGELSKSMSGTRFNNTLAALRQLFEIGIENGVRQTNPAAKIRRQKPSEKDLTGRLPTREQFKEFVERIRNGQGRFSRSCADFVEFLAYSGLRRGEAKHVKWQHCNFDKGEVLVTGDPQESTKNRRVPMIDEIKLLLERIRNSRPEDTADSPVLLVNESQKAMDRAAEEVGMPRITHHDLRHLFATTCIESGVDIPTVSKWLGHKDGGALAMKVYGHLRNEHSLAAARLVSFSS
ncbi:MAG: integrase [Verrucomicrobiales bacterium]|jgi:integrase